MLVQFQWPLVIEFGIFQFYETDSKHIYSKQSHQQTVDTYYFQNTLRLLYPSRVEDLIKLHCPLEMPIFIYCSFAKAGNDYSSDPDETSIR